MKEMFEELNSIPHEKRKEWGQFGHWTNYHPYLGIVQAEINRLDRANEAVKKTKAKPVNSLPEAADYQP
jgi:hypothetical protein